MSRTYQNWEHDARNTTKSVTKLGNELRDRWDDWKPDAPYKTFDECIMTELGITAHALRIRNSKARAKASVSRGDGNQAEVPRPVRQKQYRSTPEERERRAPITAQLWADGYARELIAEALGISHGTINEDLVATGTRSSRNRMVRRGVPEGDFRWRNEDVAEDDDDQSTIERPSFAACETPSATQAIEDVRVQLSLILGGRYRLSLKDRNGLISILNNALERLHNGESQEATDSPHGARVAG